MQPAVLLLLAALGTVTWGGHTDAKTRVRGIKLGLSERVGTSTCPGPRRSWGIDGPGTGLASRRRVARNTLTAVYDNGVETGRYDYDRNLQRVKRRTAQENVEYVLDDRFVLQEARGNDSTHPSYRWYHYGKEPLAVADSGQSVRFLSVDALGSVSDFTTTSGTLYSKRQYDAWGQYRNGTAPAANQPKLGYTGHQFDPETGLVYARARYYDAETGVFLSRDPIDLPPDAAPNLHRFIYAASNPLRYTDPSGEILPFLAFVALAGVIGGEIDFIKQELQKQFTSFGQAMEQANWTEVGTAAGTTALAAAAGYGGAVGGAAIGGTIAEAGAGAVGLGELGTAAVTGAGAAFGGGVGGDLAVQATQVALGQRDEISVSRALTFGAALAPFGAAAGVVRQATASLGAELGSAAAEGFQAGAAGLSGAPRAATVSAASAQAAAAASVGAAWRGASQVVEAAEAPGTARVAANTSAQPAVDAALAQERQKFVRLLHKRELGLDPAHGGQFNASEAEQGYSVEVSTERLRRDPTGATEWLGRGKSYDAVGPFPAKYYKGPADVAKAVAASIRSHARKADVIPVDLSDLGEAELQAVRAEIARLPTELQRRLMFLGGR